MPLLAAQDRGEYYSKKITGIKKGIMLPVGAGPLGIETSRRNELIEKHAKHWIVNGDVEDEGLFFGQKSNSAYAVVNMAQHFYMTYDEEYTKLYYPFVKGVATFWENYLPFENGRYVIYNDAIHEGTIGTLNPILSLGRRFPPNNTDERITPSFAPLFLTWGSRWYFLLFFLGSA